MILNKTTILLFLTISTILLAILQKIFLYLDTYSYYNNNFAQFNDAGLYFLVFPYFICITTFKSNYLIFSIVVMDIIAYVITILVEKFYYPDMYLLNIIPMIGWLMNDFAIIIKINFNKKETTINLFKNLDYVFFVVLSIHLLTEFILNLESNDDFVFNYLNLRVTILLYEYLFNEYITRLFYLPIFWVILAIRLNYQILVSLFELNPLIYNYNVLQYYNGFYCLVELIFLIVLIIINFDINKLRFCDTFQLFHNEIVEKIIIN